MRRPAASLRRSLNLRNSLLVIQHVETLKQPQQLIALSLIGEQRVHCFFRREFMVRYLAEEGGDFSFELLERKETLFVDGARRSGSDGLW